ncbi:GDP-mannose 4,6-dehydratase [Pseudomonas protegens]|nr:GDP-mannose 4,6-dehydratase [Pseudomonas protegens]MCL9657972.1 GDP-mannose 4,6-dehydratase [Pseudomonas protegens]
MMASNKRALITGAQGFTGRYMIAELRAHGYEVIGLGSHPSNEADYRQMDLMDADGLCSLVAEIQPSVVIHLAALAFVAHGDANAFYQVNLIGTRNLLTALAKCGSSLDAVLLASSANVYGNASEGLLSEAAKAVPTNDYAVSKLAMEHMARLWQNQLPIIITRPFNYTGVGQPDNFLLPKIVTHFKNRAKKIELGNLDIWRDFSDVRALVWAYRELIEADAIGKTINVCSGKAHSLREVIFMCQDITGHTIEVEINKNFVRTNEVKTLCGDASLLCSIIKNWKSPPLEETLLWMLNK